jgi:hypothetical protein
MTSLQNDRALKELHHTPLKIAFRRFPLIHYRRLKREKDRKREREKTRQEERRESEHSRYIIKTVFKNKKVQWKNDKNKQTSKTQTKVKRSAKS